MSKIIDLISIGQFLEKNNASDGIQETYAAICKELVEAQNTDIQQAKVTNCALWRSSNRCGVVLGIMSCGDKPCQVAIAQSATIC